MSYLPTKKNRLRQAFVIQMDVMFRIVGFLAMGILLCCVPMSTAWSKQPSQMAVELARLRSEVEALSARLEEKKEIFRAKMRSLAMQRSSLELSLQREKQRLAQLQKKQNKRQEQTEDIVKQTRQLTPVLLGTIGRLRWRVQTGLPFQTSERLRLLDDIAKKVKAHGLDPREGIQRVWSFLEDEFRLNRENGLYKQVITLQGKQMLVEVVRIGMMMLFFCTKDGRCGRAVREKNDWSFVPFLAKEEHLQIQALFDGFRKKIRVGFWLLPNALPTQEKGVQK